MHGARPHGLERARVGVERLLVLGEVADPDRRADPDLALGRRELADERLQEHALARAVRADDADALAVQDGQVDAGEHDVVAERDADLAQLEDALAAAGVRAQPQPDPAPLEHRPLDLLHPVDLPLLVARLLDVALVDDAVRPVLEAADRRLQARDLLLLRDVRLLLALELELAGERVRRVVARPDADAAAVELGDLADRLVEQVAVVRDDDDRAVEGGEQRSTSARPTSSRCASGSSSSSTSGSCARQAASAISLRWPPESAVVGRLSSSSSKPERRAARARAALEARPAGGLPALEQLLLAAEHPRHAVEVGGDLGRAEPLGDAVQLAVELGEVGAGGEHRLERVRSSPSGCCGRNETTTPRRRTTCLRRAPRARRAAGAASTCRSRSRRRARRARRGRPRGRARRGRAGCRTTCGRRSAQQAHGLAGGADAGEHGVVPATSRVGQAGVAPRPIRIVSTS